jgi:hypothetical protein
VWKTKFIKNGDNKYMTKGIAELSNIDKICKRFSMEIASGQAGKSIGGTSIKSLNPKAAQIIRQHRMTGGFGPVRSSYEHNGKTIEFVSMVQSFEITSQELFDLTKDLAHHLRVDANQERAGTANVRVSFGADMHVPILLNEADFAYSGNEFIGITSPDNKIVTLKGTCNGIAYPEAQHIFLNVISGDLNALIHEVLHLKVAPDAFQVNDAPIGQIGSLVSSLIQEMNSDKREEWCKKLELARMKALESFTALNDDLGNLIPNDW